MMVHVMVFQVKTLCYLPRGLQCNGKAAMKTEVRYPSATLLATYQTTQNIAMWASVSGMFSASHRNFPCCSSVESKFVYQSKTWLVLNTKHRLSGLWHRVVWQAGTLPTIRRSLDFMLPSSCTDNTVKTLQAPLTCVCQVCTWRFSQATLYSEPLTSPSPPSKAQLSLQSLQNI
jgi:hypothetical protein